MTVQTEELTRKINSNLMGEICNKSPGLLKNALVSIEICWQKAEWQSNQKTWQERLTVCCSFALVLVHSRPFWENHGGGSICLTLFALTERWAQGQCTDSWQYVLNFVCSYRTLSSRSMYRVSRRSWRISRSCCARPGQCSGQRTAVVALWCTDFSLGTQASVTLYHWQLLPQVSFLSRQTCACHDEARLWLRQKYACPCCDKTFVVTKYFCRVMTKLLLQQIFVATNIVLWQHTFCCNKHTFVVTKMHVCRDNATSIFLSWQKTCFVTTKIILVAAPANDNTIMHTFLKMIKMLVCKGRG